MTASQLWHQTGASGHHVEGLRRAVWTNTMRAVHGIEGEGGVYLHPTPWNYESIAYSFPYLTFHWTVYSEN